MLRRLLIRLLRSSSETSWVMAMFSLRRFEMDMSWHCTAISATAGPT